MDNYDNSNRQKNDERNPSGVWPAVIDAIRSYAANQRAQAEEAKKPRLPLEGCWAKVTAISTAAAAVLAFVAAVAFWRQLEEMQAEQRPWVYATEVTPAGHIILARGQYAVPIRFTITNTGRTPAFFVEPKAAAVVLGENVSTHTLTNTICDEYRGTPAISSGQTVFAGQVVTHGGFTSDDYPAVEKSAWDATPGRKVLIIFGCVDYAFPGQQKHHQSRFSFVVGTAVDQGTIKRITSLPDDPTSADLRFLTIGIGGDGPLVD